MNSQSRATEKWQKSNGYISKAYKLKKDVVEAFAEKCKEEGKSQAQVLTQLMLEYIHK